MQHIMRNIPQKKAGDIEIMSAQSIITGIQICPRTDKQRILGESTSVCQKFPFNHTCSVIVKEYRELKKGSK